MQTINYIGEYTYSGVIGSGTTTLGNVPIETTDLTCGEIQIALNSLYSPDSFPVDCDFITLSNTGVVFFMDPNTQQLTNAIEVSTINNNSGITKEDIDFIYKIEGGLISLVLFVILMIRQFRKFGPKLFNKFD